MIKNFFAHSVNLLYNSPEGFKKGDTVQRISGGYVMVILNIKRNPKKSPSTILCQWYDREQKLTMKSTFLAIDIKLFDWYNPD